MQIEIAKFSHIGDREENQDCVEILIGDHTVLAMVLDGMGGHSAGAEAAMAAVATISDCFRKSKQPLPFPSRFLSRALGEAHEALVLLGQDEHIDAKPRATCAVCLVQEQFAYWGHLGDSRVYHLRGGDVLQRTRDHTHVELLLQEGLIDESEIAQHPMRSFVETCLGGDRDKPTVTLSEPTLLEPGDTLLLCSDGFWGGLRDPVIAQSLAGDAAVNPQDTIRRLVRDAVASNTPNSDNTTAAALIWRGTD